MGRFRTPQEKAAGQLISAVQKVWGDYAGEPGAQVSEDAMHRCHDFLLAAKQGTLVSLLNGQSVADYIGPAWVRRHPQVLPAIRALESLINKSQRV